MSDKFKQIKEQIAVLEARIAKAAEDTARWKGRVAELKKEYAAEKKALEKLLAES